MELFNTYEKQIIELLLKSDKPLSHIAKKLGISKPATSKYLQKLEKQDIIKGVYEKNTIGRIRIYSIQPAHLVFSIDPESQTIIHFQAHDALDPQYLFLGYIKQANFRREVKTYLQHITKIPFERYLILLYGSIAQGTGRRKSDIDLLLIKTQWTKKDKEQILLLIAEASKSCDHQAKPLFKTVTEFKGLDASLQTQIKHDGIILFEKGTPWGEIKTQLQRYKSITI